MGFLGEPLVRGTPINGQLSISPYRIFGLEVGIDTFDKVRQRLGSADLHGPGSKSEAPRFLPRFLCYVSTDESDPTVIAFVSRSLDFFDQVTEVAVGQKKLLPQIVASCMKSKQVNANAVNIGILDLGISRQQFLGKVGPKTSYTDEERIAINFQLSKQRGQKENTLSDTVDTVFVTGILAHFTDDRLDWYRVYQANAY